MLNYMKWFLILALCVLGSCQYFDKSEKILDFTQCYSLCSGCQQFPSNCKICSSSLIFLNNHCVTNSRESVLTTQFFPLVPTDPNSEISTKGIENTSIMYDIDNCTYLNKNGNGTAPFYFIMPNGPFTRFYNQTQLPSHSYINIKFIILIKGWGEYDTVNMEVNGNLAYEFSYDGSDLGDLVGVACQNSSIQVKTLQFSLPDINKTLNFTLVPHLQGSTAKYGFNSLLIRYGNCQRSCETCTGSTANKCSSCRSFLIWKNYTCETCSHEYYYNDSACWRCHYSCLTCSGSSELNCTNCDTETYDLVNGKCVPKALYYQELVHDFKDIIFTTNSGWKLSTSGGKGSDVSVCGRYSYLGGYQIGTSTTFIQKVFNDLPTHFAVRIQFIFIAIDNGQSKEVSYLFQVDDEVKEQRTPTVGTTTNECGLTSAQALYLVKLNNIKHISSSLKFRLRPSIDSSSNYGIRDFLLYLYKCSPGCLDCSEDQHICKECGGSLLLENGECKNCAPGYYRTSSSGCEPCNVFCKECTGPLANQCKSCDKPLILSGTQCIQDSNYEIYGVYLNEKTDKVNPTDNWNIYPNLQNRGNDKCGNHSILGNSQLFYKNLQMTKIFEGLPKHTAISIHFNVFQIDDYSGKTLSFVYDGGQITYKPAQYGVKICGNGTRDAITKVIYSVNHTADRFSFELRAHQIAKLGIANMIIFLQNCAECKGQLQYSIDYMPVYQVGKKGLNIWLDFNYKNKNLSELNHIFSSIIGPKANQSKNRLLSQAFPVNFTVESVRRDCYKLFTKLNQSVINNYLKISTNSPSLILSKNNDEEGVQKPLITTQSSKYLTRYDVLVSNRTRRTMNNMHNFNYGFTNSVFYVSLVLIAFGLAVLLEDFVHLLQIVFMYIFIASSILPITLKFPLSGMKRIQFLNFFSESNKKSIETWFLPKDFYQNSHHVFEQYQPDVNFLRAVYALIIFNLFYILLWVIGSILFKNVKVLREKSYNPYLRYFQDIWARPFTFFDSIVRYQFIAIVWAALLQFTHFTSPYAPYSGINAFLTITFFIAFLAYPIGAFLYLKTQYSYMTNQQFQFLYCDSFYKRIVFDQSPQQNPHPFLYIMFKNYLYFLICLVICLSCFYQSTMGALISMLVLISLDTAWIFIFKIYTDGILRGFKTAQNVFLLFLTIMYFVVNGQADSMPTDQFLQLGFGCEAIVIMLVVNATLKTIYLVYLRSVEFRNFKHSLKMSAIENSHVNDAEKQLLKSRSKLLGSKIAASSNMILPSNRKTIKSMVIKDPSQMASKVTSLNKFVE